MRRDDDCNVKKMHSQVFRSKFFTLLVLVMTVLSGCGGGAGDTPVNKTPESIVVQPANNKLAIGKTQQFKLVSSYTGDMSASAVWSSSSPSTATITPGGMVSAVAVGQTTISATKGGVSYTTILTVPASTLVSIAVTPSTSTLAIGTAQQFKATGAYSDGTFQDLSSTVIWSSATTSVATIAPGGKASAVGAGSATITAASGSISGIATLTVSPVSATLVSIAVTPATPTIAVGTSQQFTATGTFSNSTTQDVTSSVTWSSSASSIVTITQAGKASAVAPGTITITAASGAISGTTTLTVSPLSVTLQSIAISPSTSTLAAGSTRQLIATGTFTDSSTQDLSSQVTWSSVDSSIANISVSGITTALIEGTTTISAAFGGKSGALILNVTPVVMSGIWEGTYTIYDDPRDPSQIGTYSFKFELTQSGTSVTGTSSLRYIPPGLAAATGTFTIGKVTGNTIDFTFEYNDPKFSRKMVNVGTAKITDTSMTGNVLENDVLGYNCAYIFSLKKL